MTTKKKKLANFAKKLAEQLTSQETAFQLSLELLADHKNNVFTSLSPVEVVVITKTLNKLVNLRDTAKDAAKRSRQLAELLEGTLHMSVDNASGDSWGWNE